MKKITFKNFNKIKKEELIVEVMMDEADKVIDKAKFIVSNVYHFLRAFYSDKHLHTTLFQNYLNSFKSKFKHEEISYEFSFNIMNKSPKLNEPLNKKSNEEIFYDILYKQLINAILEQNNFSEETSYINSFVSLRNCFIFLEYLYLLIINNSLSIDNYILKIDISFLIEIIQKTSKRLINSDEFFYLNLIELKGIFPLIKYSPTSFIKKLDNSLYIVYKGEIQYLKIQKMNTLELQLDHLLESLSIYNNNKVIFLNDYLSAIYSNLKEDRNNPNLNNDSLIKKYIFDAESPEKKNKNLEQILNEINEEKNKIPEFNYLYLIALNQK